MATFQTLIRKITKYFPSFENEVKGQFIRLNVSIDHILTRNDKSMLLSVNKKTNLGELRDNIAKRVKISENIFLFINGRFWDDTTILIEAIDNLKVVNGGYEVYAVIITTEDEDKIDYNVEDFLRKKYSTDTEVETGFLLMETNASDFEHMEETPVVCSLCKSSKQRDSIIALDYCDHEFCKVCLFKVVWEDLRSLAQCPQKNCERFFLDHEVQKILGVDEYRKWENVIERKSHGEADFRMPKMGWICQSCTFLNKPFVKFCDTCSDNRPSNYSIPRLYKPTEEEEYIQRNDEEEKKLLEIKMMQEEEEKNRYLEELKNLAKQNVTYTREVTECPICMLDYEAGEAIILHSCLHTVCRDCLQNYLVNIENAQVKCPTENCIGLLEDQEIRAILTEEQYSRYDDLNLRMAEATEKSSFHCKEVNCTAWFVNGGNINTYDCPRCGKRNCVPCKAIHENLTCQEYQAQKLIEANDPTMSKNDVYIQSLIDCGEAMKCPGCQMIVEKNRGCDGVTCRNCQMMICWATKGPRWGPKGKGDRSGGCGCRFLWGRRCHPSCRYCH